MTGTCSAGLGERIGGGIVPAARGCQKGHYDSGCYASGSQGVVEKAALSLGFRAGRGRSELQLLLI